MAKMSWEKKEQRPRELWEQYYSASDQIYQRMVVVNSRLWLAGISLLTLVTLLVLWAFFGSIPIKVEGNGVLISAKGTFSVETKVSGIVEKIFFSQGEFIKSGQVLAEIIDPQQSLKEMLVKTKVDILKRDLSRLKGEITREYAKEKEALERSLLANTFTVSELEKELPSLEKEYKAKKELFDEGIIGFPSLRESESRLSQKKIELENVKSTIAKVKSDLSKGYRTEEYKAKEQQLFDAEMELNLSELTSRYAKLISPYDGIVLESLVREGNHVTQGDPIVWLERPISPGAHSEIVQAFIPISEGKKLKKGTRVLLEVSTVDYEEYGKMIGTVMDVSPYAISVESIAKGIPNSALIKQLMGEQNAVISVQIAPDKDETTPSGYRWTSSEGPPFKVSTGTICKVQAIVERVQPIYYIYPFSEFKEINL